MSRSILLAQTLECRLIKSNSNIISLIRWSFVEIKVLGSNFHNLSPHVLIKKHHLDNTDDLRDINPLHLESIPYLWLEQVRPDISRTHCIDPDTVFKEKVGNGTSEAYDTML